jgi:hypothetical protein
MHHPENNLEPDLSSTMAYRRDSVRSFLRYFLRFFFGAGIELPAYFWKKRRRSLFLRTVIGEGSFFVGVAVLCVFVDWRAAVTVFVVPLVTARFAMMAGNWAQHAFIDQRSPENCYRNSITCINCVYNRRCFNDGYHIGHHVKQTRHWTEMPDDFLRNVDRYAAEDALVFEGIDFFGIWLLLMLKQYRSLAKKVVPLGGVPRSLEQTIELLRSRTRWTSAEETT